MYAQQLKTKDSAGPLASKVQTAARTKANRLAQDDLLRCEKASELIVCGGIYKPV